MKLSIQLVAALFIAHISFASGEKTDPDADNDNIIVYWNKVGLELNRVDHTGEEGPGDSLRCTQGPPNSAIQLALAHGAMFDAYNSIVKTHEPLHIQVPHSEGGDIIAAVSTAAKTVFITNYPLQEQYIRDRYKEVMNLIGRGDSKRRGIRAGKKAAAAMIDFRKEDKSCHYGSYKYSRRSKIPAHQTDPNNPSKQVVIGPKQGYVKPFTMEKITQVAGKPPPHLKTSQYRRAFDQVKSLGADGVTNPTTRLPDETVIGWYHSYNGSPYIGTPCVLVCEVIIKIISEIEGLSMEDYVLLFTEASLAMADGGIASWRDKFGFNFWRPIVGIRRAHKDRNKGTNRDKDWYPLGAARSNPFPGECNFTPPFPSFTSGHATFCAAGLKALMNVLQRNEVEFDFVSAEFNGTTWDELGRVRPRLNQVFNKISVFSSQCAASRIFNGVHWVFDGTVGAKAGYAIADYIHENLLVPVSGPDPKAFSDAPKVGWEIQSILKRRIEPVFEVLDSDVPLEDVIQNYLDTPVVPGRESCVRPLVK